MTDRIDELRGKLVRNFKDIERVREHRPPLYDTLRARLAKGTLRVAGEMLPVRAGEYPDSGKYLASASRGGDACGFARMHREKDDLDYWDGEP